ncbi:hypothetical protein D3C87_2057340 [compost metagenome]
MFADQIGHLITDSQMQAHHGMRLLEFIEPREQYVPADIRRHRQTNDAGYLVTALCQCQVTIVQRFQRQPRVRQVPLAIIGQP